MPRSAQPRGSRVSRYAGSHCTNKRLGKNSRPSDWRKDALDKTKTHTMPVEHRVSEHYDDTGARDPSRIRHEKTKQRHADKRRCVAALKKVLMYMVARNPGFDPAYV